MEKIQKRQPAYFVEVNELLTGDFTKNEGWDPNFVTTSFGMKVSRTTVIGTIIEVDDNSITIDDSTGIITVRSFEEFIPFKDLKSGDFVILIGKIKRYNDQNYLTPEICKKINPEWIEYKNYNISKVKTLYESGKIIQNELVSSKKNEFSNGKEVVDEIVEESINKTTEAPKLNLIDRAIKYIDENDSGEGVAKVKILDNFDEKEIVDVIDSLIMEGDIFEIKPGVFKVLK